MGKPKQTAEQNDTLQAETAIYSVHKDGQIVSVQATSISEAIEIANNTQEVIADDSAEGVE